MIDATCAPDRRDALRAAIDSELARFPRKSVPAEQFDRARRLLASVPPLFLRDDRRRFLADRLLPDADRRHRNAGHLPGAPRRRDAGAGPRGLRAPDGIAPAGFRFPSAPTAQRRPHEPRRPFAPPCPPPHRSAIDALLLPSPGSGLIAAQFYLRRGSADEAPGETGLASFTAGMLKRGPSRGPLPAWPSNSNRSAP
jgi:hypothetical protein